jgi:thiol:disulfide interchange protein DsbD
MALDVLMPLGAVAPAAQVGLPMAFTLGFTFGMGPCLLACLPYLGPVFLNSDGGVRQSWRILLPLSLGRLTGYIGFGLAGGLLGQVVSERISSGQIKLVLGAAALMVGLALLWRVLGGRRGCSGAAQQPAAMPLVRLDKPALPVTPPAALMPGGLYLMGLSMALTPCAPLGVVLVAATALASAGGGALLGLSFGLGAVLVPSLVYGLGVAYFGKRLREQLGPWRARIEVLSAALLILTGAMHLLRAMY